MQRLALFRLGVLIVIRDIFTPVTGIFLSVYLPVTHSLSPWHLPLIAGMLGTPLVARGSDVEEPSHKEPLDKQVEIISARTESE